MKIIRQGKAPKEELFFVRVYTIECEKCGCVFEVQDSELVNSGGYSGHCCPCCHNSIILENNYSERIEKLPRKDIAHYNCSIHKRIY